MSTLAVRRESVQIHVDSNLSQVAARDAAAVALLRRELDSLSGHRFFQSGSNSPTGRGSQSLGGMQRQADSASNSINQLTGRLGLVADAALVLGPALVPVGALAGQAAAGLAAMGAAAATAAASGVIAFQGIADAVKAVQKYADDPSLKNLEAANKELRTLAPAAQRFVVEFQKARPILSDVQEAAARGWFPGLTKALGELDEVSPKLERILITSGRMGGDLVADGLKSLGSERWSDFLDFVADEVPTAEAAIARIMGDLAHGAAQMWMAFDPGNDSFIKWVEDVADSFDRWASSAEGREDIADFLEYARETGPDVAEFLSAIGRALVAVVQAAAPLGGPALQALTAVSKVIETFAQSNLATPLLAGLAALRLYTRGAALAAAAQARLNATIASAGGVGAGAARGGVPLFGALTASQRASMTAQQQAQRQAQQRAAVGQGAGMALGVGLLASGAASDLGITNTALLTLAGTMAGPVGAGLGAVAGLALDAAAANDTLTKSLDAAGSAIKTGDFASAMSALEEARKQQAAFQNAAAGGGWFKGVGLAGGKNALEGLFGDSDVDEGQKALDALNRQMFISQHAAGGLADALGTTRGPLDGSTRSVQELQHALEQARPAMDRLGISQEDLFAAKSRETNGWGRLLNEIDPKGSYTALTGEISRAAKWMDTAAYRAQHYRAALRDLATETGTAAERADNYREAFDGIVKPANDAEAALVAQTEALRAIRQLSTKGDFDRTSEAGREALNTTRAYTDAVRERIATMIAAKRSDDDITAALKQSRREFIESGVAAGFSAKEMAKRADAIGLTPKLIETTFHALGVGQFEEQVRGITNLTRGVPRRVLTDIATNGIPQTEAAVQALLDKYELTEEQRTAVLALIDRASGQIPAAIAALDRYDGRVATSTLILKTLRIEEKRDAATASRAPRGSAGDPTKADGGTVDPRDRLGRILTAAAGGTVATFSPRTTPTHLHDPTDPSHQN